MRLILLVSLFGALSASALALTIDTPLLDSTLEARAQTLFRQIRCVVCQGQALAGSDAAVAVDMRLEIRRQIEQKKSDDEILHFLEQRFGSSILMKPAFNRHTLLLWSAPLWLLLLAGIVVYGYFRRRSR